MTQISRYSLTLIVAAAIIIEVLGAAQYFMARSGARNELLAKAQRDMQRSLSMRIQKKVRNSISLVVPSLPWAT